MFHAFKFLVGSPKSCSYSFSLSVGIEKIKPNPNKHFLQERQKVATRSSQRNAILSSPQCLLLVCRIILAYGDRALNVQWCQRSRLHLMPEQRSRAHWPVSGGVEIPSSRRMCRHHQRLQRRPTHVWHRREHEAPHFESCVLRRCVRSRRQRLCRISGADIRRCRDLNHNRRYHTQEQRHCSTGRCRSARSDSHQPRCCLRHAHHPPCRLVVHRLGVHWRGVHLTDSHQRNI